MSQKKPYRKHRCKKGQIVSLKAKGKIVQQVQPYEEKTLQSALQKGLEQQWKEISRCEVINNPTALDLRLVQAKIAADDPVFKPKYKSRGAAACDLVANIPEGSIILEPGANVVVDCGFRMQLKQGWEALVRPRTSLAKKNIIITNSPGTIDDDFRGRVRCIMSNVGVETVEIKHLDRIAQMCLKPVWYFDWLDCEADDLDSSERGDGMFGSTGTNENEPIKE